MFICNSSSSSSSSSNGGIGFNDRSSIDITTSASIGTNGDGWGH